MSTTTFCDYLNAAATVKRTLPLWLSLRQLAIIFLSFFGHVMQHCVCIISFLMAAVLSSFINGYLISCAMHLIIRSFEAFGVISCLFILHILLIQWNVYRYSFSPFLFYSHSLPWSLFLSYFLNFPFQTIKYFFCFSINIFCTFTFHLQC